MKQTIEIPEGFELKKVSDIEYQIVKKEVKLPDTWEEFCETHKISNEYFVGTNSNITKISDRDNRERDIQLDQNVLPNKGYAEAVRALCQLIQLRDCYRQGWKPDWANNIFNKYCISFDSDGCVQIVCASLCNILSFQSEEIRDKFFYNFKDLIETASYLWK